MNPLNVIPLYFRNNILFLSMLFLLSIAGLINTKLMTLPEVKISREKYSINFNTTLHFFNIGYNRLFSSLLWIETLMNSDIERNYEVNKNSWMYFRFLSIAKLEPLFLENYQFGGQYLSIIKDDLVGSETIFKLGVTHYPENYFLNYNLGFLYFNERKDYQSALPYLMKIKDNPLAPAFIDLLIATIMKKEHRSIKDIVGFVEKERESNRLQFIDNLYEKKLLQLKNK